MIVRKYIGFLFTAKIITLYGNTAYDIDYELLKQHGVSAVLFDYDDTLGEFNGEFSSRGHELLLKLAKDFKIAIVSNCSEDRKRHLTQEYPDVYVHFASFKPDPKGYLAVMDRLGAVPEQTAMIGDRPAMDLFGAYVAGIKERILVKPYSEVFGGKRPFFGYRWLRKLETMKCLFFL